MKEWWVVTLIGFQSNGKKRWNVEAEYADPGDAQAHCERLRTEGVPANVARMTPENCLMRGPRE